MSRMKRYKKKSKNNFNLNNGGGPENLSNSNGKHSIHPDYTKKVNLQFRKKGRASKEKKEPHPIPIPKTEK